MTAPALRVRGLSVAYGERPVLREVSFDVQPGEVVAVVGPSGAGKTTLFRCATRLVRPHAGSVEVLGTDLVPLEGAALRDARRDLGLVFQSYNLVRRLTALQNVLVGRLAEAPTWRVLLRRFSAADQALAAACLDQLGLLELAHLRADRLSGGQQQRVALARVLASDARVVGLRDGRVVLDVPAAAFDAAAAADLYAGRAPLPH